MSMFRRALARCAGSAFVVVAGLALPAGLHAMPFGSPALEVDEYLLIGTGSQVHIGTSVAVSNFELGANTDVVPMSGLAGSVPPLPGNALPVVMGITNDGDTAIVNDLGNFDFSNVEVWGQKGVDCSNPNLGVCISGISNSDFNGATMTPANGVHADVDLSGVLLDLSNAGTAINAFGADVVFDFSVDGQWDTDLTINLASGLTVFDFDTGGNDLSLSNENLLINGPADAFAIFRIPDAHNFNVGQSNMVVGNGGIGLHNVLFFSDKADNNVHINIDDAIVNGVAFWDLTPMMDGEVQFDNVQGCTQVVGGKINLNDVRLMQCGYQGFSTPEPSSGLLILAGMTLLGLVARSRRQS